MQNKVCLLSRNACWELAGPCKDHGKKQENNNK